MLHPLSRFFEQNRPTIGPDELKWPMEWKIIRWKAYSRYPRIILPKPQLNNLSLKKVIINRKSENVFSGKFLTPKEISDLLFYSCGIVRPNKNPNRSRRAQPSGGALYPLEIYLLVFAGSKAVPSGVYHYNVLEHCLEKLPEENIEILKTAFHYPWADKAGVIFLFSFIEERTKPKYGNLTYKHGLIEAGHIGQNFYLISTALKLKCCPLSSFNTDIIHKVLDLDGVSEAVFYAMAVGK